MPASRPTLSLRGRERLHDPDAPFEVAVYDLLLPSRNFVIRHKVTETGRVSMTVEFLLRLLRSADGFEETDLGSFFGFNPEERSFMIREAEESGYVSRKGGRVWLTATGRGLFREGGEEPLIYEVEQRTVTAGFDLISFAPAARDSLSMFELRLPELKITETAKVSAAREIVRGAFRKYYGEFALRSRATPDKKRFLYSVDHVDAGNRFSNVVRVVAKARARRPSVAEPDLSDWKTGYELDDRGDVVERCAAFLGTLNTVRHPTDSTAFDLLGHIAPEFTRSLTGSGKLGPAIMLKRALASESPGTPSGPVYTDAIAGSLFTSTNIRKIFEALRHAAGQRKVRPRSLVWLVPQIPAWGATNVLPIMLDQIADNLGSEDHKDSVEEYPRSIALAVGNSAEYIREAFDLVVSGSGVDEIPANLEILIVPGLVVAISIHGPIEAVQGFPIPVGLLSFEPVVVRRAQDMLSEYVPYFRFASGKVIPADHRAFVEKVLE
jgi:hypothetical protein